MSQRKPLPRIPDNLIRKVKEGKVVPFIGAGISMGVRLRIGEHDNNRLGRMPSYKELLLQLIDRAEADTLFKDKFVGVKEKALSHIAAGEMMAAADILEGPIDTNLRYKYLRQILNYLSAEPSLVHELLNILDFPLILTSNYDRLLENALEPAPEVLTHEDAESMLELLKEGGQFVVKVHGDVTRPQTIALGWSSYRNIHLSRSRRSSSLKEFLNQTFTQKTIIFLGCSMAGGEYTEYLRKIIGIFRKSMPGPHYALIPENSLTEEKKDEWLTRFGVHMIEYKQDETFSHIWEFLSQLKSQQKSYPRPKEVWSDFFTPKERPAYLRLQLEQEKIATSVRFLTPSLTNALAHDDYILRECPRTLEKFSEYAKDYPGGFDKFSSDTIEIMLQRAHNIEEGLTGKKLEVRAVFLQSTLDEEFAKGSKNTIDRYRRVVEMVEQNPLNLGIRAFCSPMSKKEFERYSFALIFTPSDRLPDVTCAYASQATTNDYQTHIVLVNTRQVTSRCEEFEKFWAASLDERATLGMIKQKLATIGPV
ncbi:MAG TPA: SIR2 family protein [Thermoanaerobaculia bacterium]|jgi:hypothetical protein|nr:SIR2 family protein [Thermoanaerobaculia bacterium]